MPHPQTEPVASPTITYGGAGVPPLPGPATGKGGNETLYNQNEKSVLDLSFQKVPVEYPQNPMYDERGRY